MPVLFTCPHCETKTLVEPQFMGHAGACAACGKPITIPALDADPSTPDAKRSGPSALKVIRWLGIIGVVAFLLIASTTLVLKHGTAGFNQVRSNTLRGECRNNARLIALALNAYADDYQTYPPPVVRDAQGKPLYSWRVLLLPYLNQQALYNQFDRSKAWDADENLAISQSVPSVYRSPASAGWGEVSYALVTGPGTLFPDTGPLSPDLISDAPNLTLLVVEVARKPGSQVVWTQPFDLDIRNMTPTINGNPEVEIGGNHQGGASAATCDGRDHFLPESLQPSQLRALITPNGGEPLPDDLLDAWD